jgi:hypothetical protein
MVFFIFPFGTYFKLFGICYGTLIYFVVVWCIFPHFGILHQGKSGNPGDNKMEDQLNTPIHECKFFCKTFF